ncbi:MAG: MBL fold metallo-hydrolase [Candidatus Hydrogenedentes bacterium]|nr:MBL fold metallo-hydrolase [Candidatus Hydrogenedentota bacterium]
MSKDISELVVPIDCHYITNERACAFLLVEGDRASFVDNNTVFAVPYLLEALEQRGLKRENVDYIVVTHVHLDHAGGTAELIKHCPNAKVIAHPKASRHLTNPSRLIEGARAVYGEPLFTQLYGEIQPVPEERIYSVSDNEMIIWGERKLIFMHVLGHATHHICIYDSKVNGVFTGDSFGIGISDKNNYENLFIIASTAPADFDPFEAEKTINRILDLSPDYVFLPHYGIHKSPEKIADKLLRALDSMRILIDTALAKAIPDDKLMDWLCPRVEESLVEQIKWCGYKDVEGAMKWLGDDPRINAMGLMMTIQRMRKK